MNTDYTIIGIIIGGWIAKVGIENRLVLPHVNFRLVSLLSVYITICDDSYRGCTTRIWLGTDECRKNTLVVFPRHLKHGDVVTKWQRARFGEHFSGVSYC